MAPDTSSDTVRQELVFVDSAAQDYQQLVGALSADPGDDRQIDVALLDSSSDGIEEITETLAGYDDLDQRLDALFGIADSPSPQ